MNLRGSRNVSRVQMDNETAPAFLFVIFSPLILFNYKRQVSSDHLTLIVFTRVAINRSRSAFYHLIEPNRGRHDLPPRRSYRRRREIQRSYAQQVYLQTSTVPGRNAAVAHVNHLTFLLSPNAFLGGVCGFEPSQAGRRLSRAAIVFKAGQPTAL